jgi:hypothetical protein
MGTHEKVLAGNMMKRKSVAMLLLRTWHLGLLPLQIVYAERPLTDNHRSLASYGLKDGDVVILRQKENADPRPAVQFSSKSNTHHILSNTDVSR